MGTVKIKTGYTIEEMKNSEWFGSGGGGSPQGKTPEKIKKGMTCCLTRWEVDHLTSCHTDCPYQSEGIWCRNVLMADIKAWNKQLESRLAQVERERDAAVNDVCEICYTCKHRTKGSDYCEVGIYMDSCECTACGSHEWRGVCEENTKDGNEGKA